MKAPTYIEKYLDLGYRNGLLEKGPVETLSQLWRKNGRDHQTPKDFADSLVREGLLTRFQADKLLAGLWRGFVIRGKYRLLERLGSGGMGEVYLCEHILMGRKVAPKILPGAQARDHAALARSAREARAVA